MLLLQFAKLQIENDIADCNFLQSLKFCLYLLPKRGLSTLKHFLLQYSVGCQSAFR